MARKVFICAGHGGSDPGACANGLKEKDVNLVIATACASELREYGVDVKMSRTKDEDDRLADVIKECNAYAPELAVDVHNNAGGGDGAEVFYSVNGTGKALASNILNEIVKIGQNSRGIKTKRDADGTDYFGFIRQVSASSVIVECAFLDNKNDVQIIDTEAEQKAMGVAIAKGILNTLGITKKPEPEKVEEEVFYRVQVGAYTEKANAEKMAERLKAAGFPAIIVEAKDETKVEAPKPTEPKPVEKPVEKPAETKPAEPKKTVEQIAREVIQGKWGNGAARRKALEAAGYNYYYEVQKMVNKIL